MDGDLTAQMVAATRPYGYEYLGTIETSFLVWPVSLPLLFLLPYLMLPFILGFSTTSECFSHFLLRYIMYSLIYCSFFLLFFSLICIPLIPLFCFLSTSLSSSFFHSFLLSPSSQLSSFLNPPFQSLSRQHISSRHNSSHG